MPCDKWVSRSCNLRKVPGNRFSVAVPAISLFGALMPELSAAIGRGEEGAWDLRNFMTVMCEGKFVWDANGGPGGAGSVGLQLLFCGPATYITQRE